MALRAFGLHGSVPELVRCLRTGDVDGRALTGDLERAGDEERRRGTRLAAAAALEDLTHRPVT